MLLKITVEQNGAVLSQSIAEIEDDESLSAAIKAAVDKVRLCCMDRLGGWC